MALVIAVVVRALGSIADMYFEPFFTNVKESLGWWDRLSGVTLLAIGNGAPDLGSTISAFRTNRAELAFSGITGAAFFVMTVVVAQVVDCVPVGTSHRSVTLLSRASVKDVAFYLLAALWLLAGYLGGQLSGVLAACAALLYLGFVACVCLGDAWHHLYGRQLSRLCPHWMRHPVLDAFDEGGDLAAPLAEGSTVNGTAWGADTMQDLEQFESGWGRATLLDNPEYGHLRGGSQLSSAAGSPRAASPRSLQVVMESVTNMHNRQSTANRFAIQRQVAAYAGDAPGRLPHSEGESDHGDDHSWEGATETPAGGCSAHVLWLFLCDADFGGEDVLSRPAWQSVLCVPNFLLLVIERLTIPVKYEEAWNPLWWILSCGGCTLFLPYQTVAMIDKSTAARWFTDSVWLWVWLAAMCSAFVAAIDQWRRGVLASRRPPAFGKVLEVAVVATGLLASLVWIQVLANEVVGTISLVGAVLGLDQSMLGATALAVGNSLGDYATNLSQAKQGFKNIALTACFAGPLFNILVGSSIGIPLALLEQGASRVPVHPDVIMYVIVGLLISLTSFTVCMSTFTYKQDIKKCALPTWYSKLLYAAYAVFLVTVVWVAASDWWTGNST